MRVASKCPNDSHSRRTDQENFKCQGFMRAKCTSFSDVSVTGPPVKESNRKNRKCWSLLTACMTQKPKAQTSNTLKARVIRTLLSLGKGRSWPHYGKAFCGLATCAPLPGCPTRVLRKVRTDDKVPDLLIIWILRQYCLCQDTWSDHRRLLWLGTQQELQNVDGELVLL